MSSLATCGCWQNDGRFLFEFSKCIWSEFSFKVLDSYLAIRLFARRIINTIVSIWREKSSRHYLFRQAHSFLRATLSENCSLLATDNVCGQIFVHISVFIYSTRIRKRCLAILYRAILEASSISATYRHDGKVGCNASSIKRLSCIRIGCFFYIFPQLGLFSNLDTI